MNILTLIRNGDAAVNPNMDNLKYYYYDSGNGVYDYDPATTTIPLPPYNATNKLAYL